MTQIISEYKLLEAWHSNKLLSKKQRSLEVQVEEYLRDGWVPLGGPATLSGLVIQAMVKYIES